jgi:DNA-directed RNA polymerase specialized sigma24 family protein
MREVIVDIPFGQRKAEQSTGSGQEQLDQFTIWFSRSLEPLHFIASLILGGSEMAEQAVENCWISASRNPPAFESEGAFRSWLMRQLINESLSILHDNQIQESARSDTADL